jgi:MFS family permease
VPTLGIFLGLGLGLLAGGRIDNFADVRLRYLPALVTAVVARFALDGLLAAGDIPDVLRMWFVLVIYVLLTAMFLTNRSLPGMAAAALGTAANGIAIVANGGWMPVWQPSLRAAGLDSTAVHSSFHTLLTGPVDTAFFAHGGPLVDIIPIPIPIPMIQSVASFGDLLLGAGLAFFVFAAAVRSPALYPAQLVERISPASALSYAPTYPSAGVVAEAEVAAKAAVRGPLGHPYVRLAGNGAFSAMWLSQVVSSLGDRIHQVALVFLVARATDSSPLALGLVFAAMTVPSFLVGPVAGALVDRWDRKHVMVGSDLLRAAIVGIIPVASGVHVGLVVALVFLLAAVSSFFRPARAAALPRVVPAEDLLTANSAMWVADTATDLVGYGLGGLFVAFLGSSLALAFWLDGASYLASAALVAAIAIPPFVRSGVGAREGAGREGAARESAAAGAGESAAAGAGAALAREATSVPASILADLLAGWRFLRSETVLFATTVQAAVAELGTGALDALAPLLIASLALAGTDAPTAYGLFEMSMGVGLLGGGIVLGGLATRIPKGPSIIAAFTALGVAMTALAATQNLPLALILALAIGLANVTFVIPSQTLFQQRTPDEMLGRVVAIRLAVVNGVLAVAMVSSGALAQLVGFRPVIAICGILTAAAGLAGLLVRPIRRA